MLSRCISSSRNARPGTKWTLLAAIWFALAFTASAPAFEILDDPAADPALEEASVDAVVAGEPAAYDLYLDISINGIARNKVVAVHHEADDSLTVTPEDLADIGLAAPGSVPRTADGRIALASLPDVTYVFDKAQQTLDFTAPEAARARLIIDAGDRGDDGDEADEPETPEGRAKDFGVLVNYDVYASASMVDGQGVVLAPLTGSFEARAFGPFGLVEQTFSVLSDPLEFRRLNTTWSFSDPGALRTYRAGDVVTGALSWTRPTRLGGIQVQNDFGLRSDIVTYPVPSVSGSAALPSSVDIYIDKSNRYSGNVPEGPFEIVDVPVLTGAGTIELVVHDATGREVVTHADYFTSPRLLRPGLFDYSAEIGFARTHFGAPGDAYDRRLMGSASIRSGLTDWLTWEAHAEGGLDLLNAGTGVTMALGRLGVGQFSVSASRTAEATGAQISGAIQLGLGQFSLGARAQRSFGRFEDIASYTAPGVKTHSAPEPTALYQLSLSLPTPFEGGRANLSYTHAEPANGDVAQILAASYGQKLFEGSGSASAYYDLASGRYGASMSLWMPLGGNISGRSSVRHDSDGSSITADVGHAAGNEVGDVGWMVHADQGERNNVFAAIKAKLPAATLRAKIAHRGKRTGVTAEVSGSVAIADGGVFFANPVYDSFAVVDAGAPGVTVLHQNRVVGVTGKDGKVIVPGLAGFEKNRISIDPTNLPLDSVVENTTAMVSPARGAGVVVAFGKKEAGGTALVSFRDASGDYLPLASTGMSRADGPEFVVGYDGQALLEGLEADNIVTIQLPDGSSCIADVPYADQGNDLVDIPDVVCQPV